MLKKFFIILFASILIIGICQNVFATDTQKTATSTINGVTVNWTYKLNQSNQIKELICTNVNVLSGSITIPSTIDGKLVLSLGNKAFNNCTNITEITIPNSVTEIGEYAFNGCTKLSKINFGTGVQWLGRWAFGNCKALTSLSIPKSLINDCGNSPFYGCSNIINVTFENGISKIPAFICENLTGIKEITIPNSVTKIGDYAFNSCTKLAKINFGTGVQYLGRWAFGNCKALTSLSIPKSLINDCGNSPFYGCSNIINVTFENGISKIPAFICENLTGIKEITIPNSVTEIGVYAFGSCTALKKITILDNVINIGDSTGIEMVFKNHNKDLTIYCYKDSIAAKYALKYNIKYVYLTKPVGTKPTENNKKNNVENSNGDASTKKLKDTNKNDKTVSPVKLPKTGVSIAILFIIIFTIVVAVIFSKRHSNYKDIK